MSGPWPRLESMEGSGGEPLRSLLDRWSDARSGRGAAMHVVGPPGSGKSTLLRQLAALAASPGDDALVISLAAGDESSLDLGGTALLETSVRRIANGMRVVEASQGRRPSQTGPAAERLPWLLPGDDFVQVATDIASLPKPAEGVWPTRANIHADLLLELSRATPILLLVDDSHRADTASRQVLEALAAALTQGAQAHLMLVTTASPSLFGGASMTAETTFSGEKLTLSPSPEGALIDRLSATLARFGEADAVFLAEVAKAAGGHDRMAQAFLALSERAGAFRTAPRASIGDPDWTLRAGHGGLKALASGRVPEMTPEVRADLEAASLLGGAFDAGLLARLWRVTLEATRSRIEAMEHTGVVESQGVDGQHFAFLTPELAHQWADAMPDGPRRATRDALATLLRAGTRDLPGFEEPRRPGLDVTETWSESRRRDQRAEDELQRLSTAARLFARASKPAFAAESAVSLVERLFETGGNPFMLSGRWGRREDRERRLHISAALAFAETQLDLARSVAPEDGPHAELMATNVRLTTMRARYKEVMGAFTEAKRLIDAAVEMAGHLPDRRVRLHALRTQLEIHYSSGDHSAGRSVLVSLLGELARTPSAAAARTYGWVAEALSRWEWSHFQERVFPHLMDQMRVAGDERGVVRARLARLAATSDQEGQPPIDLLEEAVTEIRALGQLPYAAERLAMHGAELLQAAIDAHHDSLSGEFYPPDLYGETDEAGQSGLSDRIGWPVDLLQRAHGLAREADQRISRLRVLTTMCGAIYEVRERATDLLARWADEVEEPRPPRLAELDALLGQGFFSLEHVEEVTFRIIDLAQSLGLDQVVADTLYEALDRGLPVVVQRADAQVATARLAYERVGDAYGLITLLLVSARLALPDRPAIGLERAREAGELSTARSGDLTRDQLAYIALRVGELTLEADAVGEADAATTALERAIELYDQAGDIEHVQVVGDLLRDLYKRSGDLGRYRVLRERFRALESRAPGADPLGLELRIEHLLSLARQEQNEERAIEMVERCVWLFGRLPDSTTRIDECFVEISKICRRRADEAQTEDGFHAWVRRSLEAVRVAMNINRGLENFHRVFEEMHEMFDDLLAIGAVDEYVAVRAECRELAFAVGQVRELLHLFDEHLQLDAEGAFDPARLPEVRGFFEALLHYLEGLGAGRFAVALRRNFVTFLQALGEDALVEHYQEPPSSPSSPPLPSPPPRDSPPIEED